MKGLKKIMMTILLCLMAIFGSFGFAACDDGASEANGNSGNSVSSEASGSGGNSISSEVSCDSGNGASSENTTEQYTVTYDANGGAFEDGETTITATVSANVTLTAPESPKNANYTFDGWSISSNGADKWNFAVDTVSKDITLYAVWVQQSAVILSVDGASIEEQEIFMFVDKNTDSISLSNKVVCSDDSVWKLYYDKLGQMEIPTKIAASTNGLLLNGDNVFYIVVTSKDGTQTNLYELNVHRSYAISVNYYDGETLLKTQTAYTGNEYEANYTPNITGYTFTDWNYTTSVLWDNLNLYVDKTANTYTVTYDVNGGDELTDTENSVTYDSDYTLAKPTKTGYTFLGWYNGSTQLTDGNGKSLSVWKDAKNLTATAKWQANEYTVTLSTDGIGGSVSGGGEHAYDSNVTITASTYIGYAWLGWYDKDDELVTMEFSYTFQMGFDVQYMAKWNIMEEIQAFDFISSTDTCTITGIKEKTATEIVVPDYVTEIQVGAFKGCDQLENIALPFIGRSRGSTSYEAVLGYIFGYGYVFDWYNVPQNTINQLTVNSGKYTYYYYYFIPVSLRSVTINDGKVSANAFKGCSFLTEISIPLNLTNVGDYAFFGCSGLTQLVLPEKVEYLGDYAFSRCSGLTHIEFSESLKTVGDYAFENCTQLTNVELPETVTLMGEGAFKGCNSLVSLTIPFVGAKKDYTDWAYNSVFGYIFGWETSTDSDADISGTIRQFWKSNSTYYYYYIPTALTTVTVFGGKIGKYAFQLCDNLTSVVLGDNVERIYGSAFQYCLKLTNVTIGNSVTGMGSNAFEGCYKLVEVYNKSSLTITAGSGTNGDVEYYAKNVYTPTSGASKLSTDENGYIIYADGEDKILVGYVGMENDLVLPNNITEICQYAFYDCDSLTSIEIPDSVTTIGKSAFIGCSSLTSIYITDIEAWCNISGLSNIMTYDSKKTLYLDNEFITELVITDSATSIGDYAFKDCSSLTSVTIPDSVTTIGKSAFSGCSSLTSVTMGDSVTTIGYEAFFNCSRLTSVTIPDGVTSIGDYAFGACHNLTSITIPDGVTTIGWSAFDYCSSLTSVTIGNNVKTIGSSAFEDCSSLTSITIPDSVTSIGDYAFNECSSLTSVYYKGTSQEWAAISIGDYNYNLNVATRYYYIENETDVPTDGGNYWHYDENGEIAVW